MSPPKAHPLCHYHYDPLDRLASCFPLEQAHTHCFYNLNRLTTEIQGQIKTSTLQAEDQLLAQWQQETGKHKRVLIATDTPGSVIHALAASSPEAFAYMPYGTRSPPRAPLQLPGFNGERLDPVTGHYLLGNGYRAFNPFLMRFNSPDSLSPFGEGGLNTYAYCAGDPVNRVDPQGHMFNFLRRVSRRLITSRPTRRLGALSSSAQQSLASGSPPATASAIDMTLSPIPYGPLTRDQTRGVRKVSRFISRRNKSQTLLERSALAAPSQELDNLVSQLPATGVLAKKLQKIRVKYQDESGYRSFVKRYQAGQGDPQKLEVLYREMLGRGPWNHVALSDLPKKLGDIIESIRY